MKKILVSGVILLSLISLSACGSSGSKTTKTTSTETATKSEENGTYKNRTLTVPDGVLKITGFEKGTDYSGSPIFYVFFDLTNNSDKAQNVQVMLLGFISASQNTGSTTESLNYAITTSSIYQDKLDLLSKDINPGATIEGAYAYKFADENLPVTFTFTDAMFSLNDPIAEEEITIE